jgi:putative transposase
VGDRHGEKNRAKIPGEPRNKHKDTRRYPPKTNGQIERFHCTPADGWNYVRCSTSEAERRGERNGWLHCYHHRPTPHAAASRPPHD